MYGTLSIMKHQISVKRTESDGRDMKVRSRPNGLTRLKGVNRSIGLICTKWIKKLIKYLTKYFVGKI